MTDDWNENQAFGEGEGGNRVSLSLFKQVYKTALVGAVQYN